MSRPVVRFCAVGVLGVLAAGCAQQPQNETRRGFSPSQYGVPASQRVVQPGEAVPRGGGVYRVGRAYTIRGRTYMPRHDPSHDEVGMASWYGDDFHGRRTANGEIYDMYALSAAHRTLPMPSYVRVTNPTNGRSLVVRVNDRGPFHDNRVIDLSKRAAMLLDLRNSGVGRVRVTYVGRAPLDGNDAWLVTTVQDNGRPMAPERVASLAPVPDWARPRPDSQGAVQLALADRLVPLPLERPRDQPVQVAAAGPFLSAAQPALPVGQGAARAEPSATGSLPPLALLPPPSMTPASIPAPAGQTYVHVGSYRDAAQAMRHRDALAPLGTAVMTPVNVSGITFYQVRVGPLRDMAAAQTVIRAAHEAGASTARLSP